MKKIVLYSLCITTSLNFSLYSQDQEHEDLVFVFDDASEEIYPLGDVDTVYLTSEIQNYPEDLEFDPTVQQQLQDFLEQNEALVSSAILPEVIFVDEDVVPTILESNITSEQEDAIIDAMRNQPELAIHDQDEQSTILVINKDVLEELLNDQSDLPETMQDAVTISIDRIDMQAHGITVEFDGMQLHGENQVAAQITDEDDDIIPVPHDLINSVKKANKLKKKLEKKERKERAKFFKKSKKN